MGRLVMPVTLHAAADNLAIEHVARGEQGGGADASVVVGHRGRIGRSLSALS